MRLSEKNEFKHSSAIRSTSSLGSWGSMGLTPAGGNSRCISQLRSNHDFSGTLKGAELCDTQQFLFVQGQGTIWLISTQDKASSHFRQGWIPR